MKRIFKRIGWTWTTMGYTKTHLWGVSITSYLLLALSVGLFLGAFYDALFYDAKWSIRLLLSAICCLLLLIATFLASILSLLFYLGSIFEEKSQEEQIQSVHAASTDVAGEITIPPSK